MRFQGLPALRRAPTTRSVARNPCQPAHSEALAPQADGLPTRLDGSGDVVVVVSRGGQQNDLRAERQADGGAPSLGPVLSLCAFLVGHVKLWSSSHGHHLRER